MGKKFAHDPPPVGGLSSAGVLKSKKSLMSPLFSQCLSRFVSGGTLNVFSMNAIFVVLGIIISIIVHKVFVKALESFNLYTKPFIITKNFFYTY